MNVDEEEGKKAFLMENEQNGKKVHVVHVCRCDGKRSSRCDREAKSKIVSLCEQIKLVDDSVVVWLFYVGFHFSLSLFPLTCFNSSSLQAFYV